MYRYTCSATRFLESSKRHIATSNNSWMKANVFHCMHVFSFIQGSIKLLWSNQNCHFTSTVLINFLTQSVKYIDEVYHNYYTAGKNHRNTVIPITIIQFTTVYTYLLLYSTIENFLAFVTVLYPARILGGGYAWETFPYTSYADYRIKLHFYFIADQRSDASSFLCNSCGTNI